MILCLWTYLKHTPLIRFRQRIVGTAQALLEQSEFSISPFEFTNRPLCFVCVPIFHHNVGRLKILPAEVVHGLQKVGWFLSGLPASTSYAIHPIVVIDIRP